jgi:hypothetical protein
MEDGVGEWLVVGYVGSRWKRKAKAAKEHNIKVESFHNKTYLGAK